MTISPYKRKILLAGTVLIGMAILYTRSDRPRVLAVNEVPVAFWSWRTHAPSAADVQPAFAATNARTLFLRAGQFDLIDGQVQRIRPVTGSIPADIELHLVYNSARRFLNDFESRDLVRTAESIVLTFQDDVDRALKDGAAVDGIQLDLDIPSRLLPRYAELLKSIRNRIPPAIRLSITGLPTWTTTPELATVLDEVDFWIPQFYGAKIPDRLDQRMPISSPENISAAVWRVRKFKKPFYAGLAVYSYAILYGRDGNLIELRGNIDPAAPATHPSLRLQSRDRFDNNRGETRYEYRATGDLVLDGLVIHEGQTVVVEVPASEALRQGASVVRENAGENLLGICLFRMPTTGDAAVLDVSEIAAGINDVRTSVDSNVILERLGKSTVKVAAANTGSARALIGDGAFTIDIEVSSGAVLGVRSSTFHTFETLCRTNRETSAQKCSSHRANILRLTSSSWEPRRTASAILDLSVERLGVVTVTATTLVDDGRIERKSIPIKEPENSYGT